MLTYPHKKARRLSRASQRGQGLLEYSLILLFVAVVVVAGLVLLAPIIQHGLSGVMPAL